MKKKGLPEAPPSDTIMVCFSALSKATDTQANIDKLCAALLEQQKDAEALIESAEYAIKRLIKGSAALKEEVRVAFIQAFMQVTSTLKNYICVNWLVDLLLKLLNLQDLYGSKNPSRSEEAAVGSALIGTAGVLLINFRDSITSIGSDKLRLMAEKLIHIASSRVYFGIPALEVLTSLCKCSAETRGQVTEELASCAFSIDFVCFFHWNDLSLPQSWPVKRSDLAGTSQLLDLLVETVSTLSEPHALWTIIMKESADAGHLSEILLFIDSALLSSDSSAKKRLGLKLVKSCVSQFGTDLLPKLGNFSELANLILPTCSSKKKADLSLTLIMNEISSLMASDAIELNDETKLFLMSMANFRLFPKQLVHKILFQIESLKVYFNMVKGKFGTVKGRQCLILFDSLVECSNMATGEVQLELTREILCIALEIVTKRLKGAEFRNEFIERFQSFLAKSVKVVPLPSFLELVEPAMKKYLKSDKIAYEAYKECRKLEAKASERADGEVKVLLSVIVEYLRIAQLWLVLDPLLVCDSVEDVKKICRSLMKKSKRADVHEQTNKLLDLHMRLLSSSSSFLKSACDDCVLKLLPSLSNDSIDLIFEAVNATRADDLMEDIDKVEDDDEEDEVEEEIEFEFDVTESTNKIRKLDEESSEKFEEEVVYLDDADEAELAQYDAKLSEIFKLKTESKSKKRLAAQSTLHFKMKLINWIRLILTSKDVTDFSLFMYTAYSLLESCESIVDHESSAPLFDFMTGLLQASISRKLEGSEVGKDYAEKIGEKIRQTCWKNQMLWRNAASLLHFVLKICDQSSLLGPFLVKCYDELVESPKIQKSNFAMFFSFWISRLPEECSSLVENESFFAGLASMNSHSRGVMLKYLKELLHTRLSPEVCQNLLWEYIQFAKKQLAESEASKTSLSKEIILVLAAAIRKAGSVPENTNAAVDALMEKLDKNNRNLVEQALKAARK